ncbi:MAG: ATP-binding protein [Sulfolobales archaeon]
MGLLYRFLKVDDPESPLFGRAFSKIELKPFSRDEAVEFLKRGFEELGIEFHEYERVYSELGGIPGWLTYFGFRYYKTKNLETALNETLTYAKRLILNEFEHFLLNREIARRRYYLVMKATANCSSWSGIKKYLEAEEGIGVPDSELFNYLNHLIESSWLVKINEKYCPSEPLIGKTFQSVQI